MQCGVIWLWHPLPIGLICRQTGGGKGCGAVVEARDVVFLGQGDYSWGFQAGCYSGLCQELVEDLCEDSSQLICIVLHQVSHHDLPPSSGWRPATCASPHALQLWGLSCCGPCGVVVLSLVLWRSGRSRNSAAMPTRGHLQQLKGLSCNWSDTELPATSSCCCYCSGGPLSSSCSLPWPFWCPSSGWLGLCCRGLCRRTSMWCSSFLAAAGPPLSSRASGWDRPRCVCWTLSVNTSRSWCSKRLTETWLAKYGCMEIQSWPVCLTQQEVT